MKNSAMGYAGLIIGLGSISATYAQGTAATENVGLEEIVVTAERRVADVQKTAIAITTVSGEDMARKSLQTVRQVLDSVPNMSVSEGAQGGLVYLRGVGTTADSNSVDPDIAVSVDGVYGGRSEGVLNAAYDLQRIEVLRGPQGTLYGRNAIGGGVNILSAAPGKEFETTINAQVGKYALSHLDAAVNLPISDTLAFRISGMRETKQGYASNGAYGTSLAGGRVKMLWEPTDALRIGATAEMNTQMGLDATSYPGDSSSFYVNAGSITTNAVTHVQTVSTAPYAIYNPNGSAGLSPNGGTPISFNWPTDPNNPWYVDPYHLPARINNRFINYTVNIDYDLGWAKATLVPAYSWSRRVATSSHVTGEIQEGQYIDTLVNPPAGSPVGTLPTITRVVVVPHFPLGQNPAGTGDSTEKQTTIEARLASADSSKLIWVVGGLFLDAKNQPTTQVQSLNPNGSGYIAIPANRPTKSNSIFGQATYPVTPAFRITAGMRYNKDEREYPSGLFTMTTNTNPTNISTPFGRTIGGVVIPLFNSGVTYQASKYSATTWKAGIEYDVAPQSMIYADVSTGYKSGGFSYNGTPPVPYEPEYLKAYEIGSKNRFLDETLQVNANAFFYDYENYQVVFNNAYSINALCNPATSAGAFYAQYNLCTTAVNQRSATQLPLYEASQEVRNTGRAKTWGVELETQWLFTPNNKLDVAINYLHARFGEIITGGASLALDLASKQVANNSPEWSGNVGYEHYFKFSSGGVLTVRGESKLSTWYWNSIDRTDGSTTVQVISTTPNGTGGFYPYPANNSGHTASSAYQSGFTRSNAYATYAFADQHWTVGAWIKNIENKAQRTNSFSRNRTWLTAPQTYGVNLSAKF